jgi:hypothetical protein
MKGFSVLITSASEGFTGWWIDQILEEPHRWKLEAQRQTGKVAFPRFRAWLGMETEAQVHSRSVRRRPTSGMVSLRNCTVGNMGPVISRVRSQIQQC